MKINYIVLLASVFLLFASKVFPLLPFDQFVPIDDVENKLCAYYATVFLFEYLDVKYDADDLRSEMDSLSSDGLISVYNLVKVLSSSGIDGKAYRAGSLNKLMSGPVIAHIVDRETNFSHYIFTIILNDGSARIFDPTISSKSIIIKQVEFEKFWSGIFVTVDLEYYNKVVESGPNCGRFEPMQSVGDQGVMWEGIQ